MAMRFSPEFNLGHLLQLIVICGGVLAFVYTNYDRVHSATETEVQTLKMQASNLDTRLTNDEARLADRTRLDEQFAADMRTELEHLTADLGDFKVQLARQGRGK
jgi:hypothetical protein